MLRRNRTNQKRRDPRLGCLLLPVACTRRYRWTGGRTDNDEEPRPHHTHTHHYYVWKIKIINIKNNLKKNPFIAQSAEGIHWSYFLPGLSYKADRLKKKIKSLCLKYHYH